MSSAYCQARPQVYRIIRTVPRNQANTMSFFPRVFASEFAPIFRLMDDYASQVVARSPAAAFASHHHHQVRSFQPRFDVRENKDSYELHGELPGVQRDNLTIEFTDNQTLSIQGRTQTVREEGSRPTQQSANASSAAAIDEAAEETKSVAASEDSTNYHKASVEDEDAPTSSSTVDASANSTPTSQDVQTTTKSSAPAPNQQAQQEPTSRYWVSERSVGSFARSFQFPSRIDQENIKASLSNGILSIVIPKSAAPQSRRIVVE